MRVIAGKYRSRPLQPLRDVDLRPTSDRLRETLFNVLTAGNPSALEGTVWLDLYAGTGVVGIEALSRGAAKIYFVESEKSAADLIRKNLQSLRIETGFEVLKQNTAGALPVLADRLVNPDFVFLDPPYEMHDAYQQTLEGLSGLTLLNGNSTVIAEHTKKFEPGEQVGRLHRYRKLEQSDAALSFYRLEA